MTAATTNGAQRERQRTLAGRASASEPHGSGSGGAAPEEVQRERQRTLAERASASEPHGSGSGGAAPEEAPRERQRTPGGVKAFVAQLRVELTLTARRGETLLLTLGIPVLLLVFFSVVDVLPLPPGVDEPVAFLAPGIIALAVLSTGLVQTAIGTAFERQYGVLKRLGVTPLGRPRLLAAKVGCILVVEAVQVAVLVGAALLLGWDPAPEAGVALVAIALGTVAFSGLGLAMAGRLRGEVTLAAANGLYLVLLLLGGMVFPLEELPGALRTVSELLPAAALSDLLGQAAGLGAAAATAWPVLVAWAVLAPVVAALTFRWE